MITHYTRLGVPVYVAELNPRDFDISATGRTWARVSDLAAENDADVAINFPFFNGVDGALIGRNIVDGDPLSYDIPKTAARRGFYRTTAGEYRIGHIGEVGENSVDFYVQGSPVLLEDGRITVHESIARDQLDACATARAQRTAIGIKRNGAGGKTGSIFFVVVDGRLPGAAGLTLSELAAFMRDELGCTDAINGDGGGSSVMVAGGKSYVSRGERSAGCAVFAKQVGSHYEGGKPLKIAIDAGHGINTAGKRTPDGSMREFEFNSVVAEYVREMLTEYDGVETKFVHDPTGARDVPLVERTDAANKWSADVFVSIHANAFGVGWNDVNGIETFAYTTKPAEAVRLATYVQSELITKLHRKSRGVKYANLHVLRETKMTAILVECGFMSNREEAALLKTDAYRRKAAEAIVTGIVRCYSLEKSPEKLPKIQRPATVVIDGERRPAYMIDNTTYVPLRFVTEKLGGQVERWDNENKMAYIKRGG
mgnify:CR=1 FL=1